MGSTIQDAFDRYPDPEEPHKPESIEEVTKSDGQKSLVLRVKISGRLRTIELTHNDAHSHGLSGPAAVEELRGIRAALEKLVELHGQETGSRST